MKRLKIHERGLTDGALWERIRYRPCWGCGLGQKEIYLSLLGEREGERMAVNEIQFGE